MIKKFFKDIVNIIKYNKKIKNLDFSIYKLDNFNFNVGMLTPLNIAIYGNFHEEFIEKINNNSISNLINFKPKTNILSLNSLGFAIFVGNYQAVEYLLEKKVLILEMYLILDL